MSIGFRSGLLVLVDNNLLSASTSIQKIELLRKQIILLLNWDTADELRSELFVYCVYWRVENMYLFKHLFCAEHSGHLYIIIVTKFLPDPSRPLRTVLIAQMRGPEVKKLHSVSLADMGIMTRCKIFRDKLLIISESQIESL